MASAAALDGHLWNIWNDKTQIIGKSVSLTGACCSTVPPSSPGPVYNIANSQHGFPARGTYIDNTPVSPNCNVTPSSCRNLFCRSFIIASSSLPSRGSQPVSPQLHLNCDACSHSTIDRMLQVSDLPSSAPATPRGDARSLHHEDERDEMKHIECRARRQIQGYPSFAVILWCKVRTTGSLAGTRREG